MHMMAFLRRNSFSVLLQVFEGSADEVKADFHGGWCVVATEDIPPGELLLEVPAAACIRAASVTDLALQLLRAGRDRGTTLDPYCQAPQPKPF